MKSVAALVAIIVVLLVGPVTGAAYAAPRQPAPVPGDGPLTLALDGLAPRVVTADGPTVLTVTGTLTNSGDVPVSAIGVRLQRGQPLTTEGAVRDALEGDAPTDAIAPEFQELPDALGVGQQVPVRLTVPLRGAPETTLALSGTGVYELLVNVNGVPGDGDRARLAAVRMLLPVLGLPDPTGDDPIAPAASPATPFSLLYPVVDAPRRLATVPGEPVLLTDDTLADSFTAEGRLGGLVTALAEAAPPGSAVRSATCVAVDADLLQTAQQMSQGYRVRNPDGSLVDGRGAQTAAAWLTGFASAAQGMCVLALPFADADLVALTRGGFVDSAVGAVTAGSGLVADLLGTPVLANTTWPADGVLDEPTLATLGQADVRSLVLSADGLDLPGRSDPVGTVPVTAAAPGTTAVVTDPLTTLAADGPAAAVPGVTGRGGAAAVTPAAGPLAGQDVLGTVAFRAAVTRPTGGPLVIAPPHRWDADGDAGRALLEGLGTLVTEGLLAPRALNTTATDTTERALDYPIGAGVREVAPNAVAAIGPVLDDIGDLDSSVVDDELGVDPDEVFNPLLLGAVRPASASWRGTPALATAAAAGYAARISDVRGSVSVLEPGSPFSLGTSSSPLLLTVANGLPVTMSVRVEVASTSGLRVAPIPVVEVPPLGRRQIQVSAEVLRSGVFTVDAGVRTLDGGLLGAPSRLQVRSTAYGTITLWLTGTAGVLLVVLAARRILRRIRSEPGRTADRPPRPGSPETLPHTAETPIVREPNVREPNAAESPTLPVPPVSRPSNGPIPAGPRAGRNPPAPSVRSEPYGRVVPGAPVPPHPGRPPVRPPGAR